MKYPLMVPRLLLYILLPFAIFMGTGGSMYGLATETLGCPCPQKNRFFSTKAVRPPINQWDLRGAIYYKRGGKRWGSDQDWWVRERRTSSWQPEVDFWWVESIIQNPFFQCWKRGKRHKWSPRFQVTRSQTSPQGSATNAAAGGWIPGKMCDMRGGPPKPPWEMGFSWWFKQPKWWFHQETWGFVAFYSWFMIATLLAQLVLEIWSCMILALWLSFRFNPKP